MVRLLRRAPGCPRAVLGPSQRRTALSADAVHSHSWKGGVRARDMSRSQRCSRPARSGAARPAQNVGSRMATILTQVTCEVASRATRGWCPSSSTAAAPGRPPPPSRPQASCVTVGERPVCRRLPVPGGEVDGTLSPPVDAGVHRSLRPRVILEIEKQSRNRFFFTWEVH